MIVDINLFWGPDDFNVDQSFLNACLRCVPRAYGEYVDIKDVPGTNRKRIAISRPKGYDNLNFETVFADPEDRIRAMDKVKVDKGILRWPIWSGWINLELARITNDAMAKTVREHPDRLLGLAIVPPWGDKDCIYELERCIKELGFGGVQLAANYGTLYLDAEEFRPFFRKINQLNVPIIVHHTDLPVDHGSVYHYTNMRRLLGRCITQMTCVGRIIYSGMLEELSNLKFIHTMLGGSFYAFVDLITPETSTIPEEHERFDPAASAKVRSYLKRNIYLDTTHPPPWGKAQLECAVKVIGAENVLFGSSYPLRPEWFFKGVDFIKSLDITEEEKALILGGNAVRLFNIKD